MGASSPIHSWLDSVGVTSYFAFSALFTDVVCKEDHSSTIWKLVNNILQSLDSLSTHSGLQMSETDIQMFFAAIASFECYSTPPPKKKGLLSS